jgi:protein-S-isoprenylcysteine O-methyltransferase Ste14
MENNFIVMKNKIKWENKEYKPRQIFLLLILLGVFFVIIIPAILIIPPYFIDSSLSIPRFIYEPINYIIGAILIITGMVFGLWSIYVQYKIGRGTPAPMIMPTQKLIIKKPYSYCRNPMALGTIFAYLGIGILIGSFSSITLTIIMSTALLLYIRYTEERKLAEKFGVSYLKYKEITPFIIPRLWK